MQNIGIMGGTFNPIHIGHLIAAQEVLNKMKLDKVIFIPTGNPPHKRKGDVLSPMERFEMVKLAVEDNSCFEVSDIETNRAGETYSFDTLTELHNIYYETQFHFIIGFDTLKELDTWKRIDDVCLMTNFIVVNRGNTFDEIREEALKKENIFNCKINILEIPDIQISSTGIRERLKNSESIKYLVTNKVEEYITQKGLYKFEFNRNL